MNLTNSWIILKMAVVFNNTIHSTQCHNNFLRYDKNYVMKQYDLKISWHAYVSSEQCCYWVFIYAIYFKNIEAFWDVSFLSLAIEAFFRRLQSNALLKLYLRFFIQIEPNTRLYNGQILYMRGINLLNCFKL